MGKAFISDRLPDYFQPMADMCEEIAEHGNFTVRIKYRKKDATEIFKIKYLESSTSIICTKDNNDKYMKVFLRENNTHVAKEDSFVFLIPNQAENFKTFLKNHILPVTFF